LQSTFKIMHIKTFSFTEWDLKNLLVNKRDKISLEHLFKL
jgi:hypothetical protein